MKINYKAGSINAIGELYLPKGEGPFPTILLVPYYKGIDDISRYYAKHIISAFGWGVFIADSFGEGKSTASDEEATRWIKPLIEDREELRKRMEGALESLKNQPKVDPDQLGAIGFCFGGLAAIELFKMGASIKGVAAFHALLKKKLPMAKNIKGSLLVMNGYKDPLVSLEDRVAFAKEMDEANVDWQSHIYGTAAHSFTNPASQNVEAGLLYDPSAASRSFDLMGSFFKELFDERGR